MDLVRGLVLLGFFHKFNNDVMYLALSNVHLLTWLAVDNTIEHAFFVVASVLVLRNPISIQAAMEAEIGIGEVLLSMN